MYKEYCSSSFKRIVTSCGWLLAAYFTKLLLCAHLFYFLPQFLQVRCSHLLVKHNQSRRPSSWREPNITRTKDEALDLIQSGFRVRAEVSDSTNHIFHCWCFLSFFPTEYIDSIKSGEKFESLASQFSDCSSAKNGGDLGPFGRGLRPYVLFYSYILQVNMLKPHFLWRREENVYSLILVFSSMLPLWLGDSKVWTAVPLKIACRQMWFFFLRLLV